MAETVTASTAAPVETGAVPTPADEQPGFKVFAGNLAYSTNDEGLKTFFSPVADDIISCQVILRGTRSAGYGFVAFNTAEAAQKAVDLLNKKELDGRTLIVEIAKPTEEKQKEKKEKRATKKRTSKKSHGSTDAEPTTNGTADAPVTKDVAEDATTTEGASKSKKKRNTRKIKKAKSADKEKDGAATTTAEEGAEIAPAAVEPKPKKVKAPKTPRPPKPARPVGEAPEGEPSKTMLFVANLGFSVDDAALSELFTSAGITVNSARVVRRRWGQPRRSKGYGFVDVGSEEQQKKAIELLQGKEIGGREIAVKIAVNSQEREAEAANDATGEAAPNNVPSLVAAAA